MSERLHHKHEAHEKHQPKTETHQEKRIEQHHDSEAKKARHEHKDHIEKILDKVEKEAKEAEEIKDFNKDDSHHTAGPITIGAELRKRSIKDNLKKIQRELPAPQKAFSKVIHQPAINAVSEVGEKTIARPTPLLWGGLFSLAISILVLTACRYYGYRYNFLLGMAGFVGGFFLGLLIESFASLGRKARKS